jgi:replication factor A1
MKISELQTGNSSVEVSGKVKEISEPRTFNKFGRELKVANAVLEDDSGSIKLTLWNADIEKVKVGDTVKLTNGYVNEFQGEKQLTTGKFGKLEVNPKE